MKISYWLNASGLGKNVMVDVQFDDSVFASDMPEYSLQDGAAEKSWQQKTFALPASLNGRYITAVIVAYRDKGTAAGNFAALLDDIVITK